MRTTKRNCSTWPCHLFLTALSLIALISAKTSYAINFQQVGGPFAETEAWGASWGDVNNDRCPDLFVNHHRDQASLYKNNCDGTFKDVTKKVDVDFSWLGDNHFADQHGGAWADIDGDGDQDIYVTTGARWDGELLMNEGGVLRNRTAGSGLVNDREGRMPLWFDYNHDRLLDLVIQSRTRTWTLEQSYSSNSFFDSSSYTGLNGSSNHDYGILIDLNNDGAPEYMGVPEGIFPNEAYDTSVLPFRNITNNIPEVPMTVDTAIADFNGDQLNDILVVRGRIRRSQSMQFGSNLVETWFTSSAGNDDKVIRFKSPGGDLQVDMHSFLGLVRYHFGASGYHPGEDTRRGYTSTAYQFDLDASNSINHGIKPHSPTAPGDLGIYIGYDPQTQYWEVNLANGGQYTTAYFIIKSSAPISNLEVVGLSNIDKPVPPVVLLNNGNGFGGNTVPLTQATQLGDLSNPVRCNGAVAGDFDNDMDQDIYFACSGGVENIANILYENRGNGQFDVVANAGGAAGPIGSSVTDGHSIVDNVTVADYDGDGKLDLFVTNGVQLFPVRFDSPDHLYRNTTQNGNRWIELDLVGTFSNADGIGAKVYATAGGVTQMREQNGGHHRWSQNHQRIHFGLAGHNSVDLRIEWPSGHVDNYSNVAARKLYQVKEATALTATPPGPVAPDPGDTGATDNVDISHAVYLDADNALWIRASSDLQPTSSAVLTVVATTSGHDQQLGTLNWNSATNAYQNNFKDILLSPDCVTVTSSGGGSDFMAIEGAGGCDGGTTPPPPPPSEDNVDISHAIYLDADNALWVRASSDLQPASSAVLTVVATTNGHDEQLGTLIWNAAKNAYQNNFKDISISPDCVTVISSGGGSDSMAVEGSGSCDGGTTPPPPPPTETISAEKVIYFSADHRLWIRAGSDLQPEGSSVINASLVYGSTETPLGQIGWKSDAGQYQQVFQNIVPAPDRIVLSSPGGGSVIGEITIQ